MPQTFGLTGLLIPYLAGPFYFASPEKAGNHRALTDIRESIKELKYYRTAVFVPAPGPDSEAARAIAAALASEAAGQDGVSTG